MAEPTKAQIAWLEKLEDGRPYRIDHAEPAGVDDECREAGWTAEHWPAVYDCITPLGRQVLADAREREASRG